MRSSSPTVVAGLLALGCMTCGGPKSPLGGYGTTTFVFDDPSSDAFRVERVVLLVDGKQYYDQRDEDPGTLELSRLALTAGDHDVATMVTVSFASPSSSTGRCDLDVGSTQRVRVGKDAARVALTVRLQDGTIGTTTAPNVVSALSFEHASAASSGSMGPSQEEDCRDDEIGRALCYAKMRRDKARAAKDIVVLNCVNDKLVQLEVAARTVKEKRTAIQGARSDDEKKQAQALLDGLMQRAMTLRTETQQCGGDADPRYADILLDNRRVRCTSKDPVLEKTP